MNDATTGRTAQRQLNHGLWWKALIGGTVLWLITAWVTSATQNSNLIPTVIMLGSFLVPFCVVLYVVERAQGSLDTLMLFMSFFIGGIFGVLGASILEQHLTPSLWVYVGVGAIEELVKALVLLVAGTYVMHRTALRGAWLGAVVGAGFAAFESAGYAFNAGLTRFGAIDLDALIRTEAVRALLTPVGHVLWTAILGAAIFGAAAAKDRYRLTGGVALAYLAVVLLHAAWDSMGWIAAWVAIKITGGIHQELAYGRLLVPTVSDDASWWSTVFYVIGLAVISTLGILLLRRLARTPATTTA